MVNFPIIEVDDATDEQVKQTYDEIIRELGFGMVPNIFKSMAIHPDLLETNWRRFRATILQGYLPRTLKEMVGIAISQANNSEYALKVHLHGLSALDISERILELLVSDFEACPLPQREKAVIRFGLMSATHPHDLTDTHYQELTDLGLTEAEIYEVIATANLFVSINQYTDAIKLEIDQL